MCDVWYVVGVVLRSVLYSVRGVWCVVHGGVRCDVRCMM